MAEVKYKTGNDIRNGDIQSITAETLKYLRSSIVTKGLLDFYVDRRHYLFPPKGKDS